MKSVLPPNAIGSKVRRFGNSSPKVGIQPSAISPASEDGILPPLPGFSMSGIGEGR